MQSLSDAVAGSAEAEAATDFGAAGRVDAISVIREFVARFKSIEPDRTWRATEEPLDSSLIREFGTTVPRLPSEKKMVAVELEVAISSPATSGRDDAAVAGTALPSNIRGPKLVILPTGSAAIRAKGVIRISRHKYLMAISS